MGESVSLCGQALRLSAQAPHNMEEILSAWLHLDQDVELSVIPASYLPGCYHASHYDDNRLNL